MHEMSLLLEAGKAMNSEIELPAVLRTILRSSMDLLEGDSGAIMLLESDDELVTVIARGDHVVGKRLTVGSGDIGQVAMTRRPRLMRMSFSELPDRFDPGETSRPLRHRLALCVPLESHGAFYGVLIVEAGGDRRYSEYDLKAASLFAEQAAGAIANSRRFESERLRVDRAELAAEFRTLYDASVVERSTP